jgi:RNA polymerase sigma-70 factor (ECF subfamily)
MRRLGMEVSLASLDEEDDRLERIVVESLGADIAQSLESLPADQRDAIRLRVLDELPYDDIARRLDCTSSVVRMRVMRGLRTLNADLEGRLT